MKKVLLDFDIGTEIDDAMALAYLLANPECGLVGITTSCGESIKRAEMASVLCRAAGKKVPIHAGCERPLLIPQMETTAPQAAILPHYEHDTGFAPNTAIPFMQKVIRENPGEVTLLAVAPMTNLGLLFAMDPELPELLDGLYLLCGSPTHQRHDVVTESLSAMERDDFHPRSGQPGHTRKQLHCGPARDEHSLPRPLPELCEHRQQCLQPRSYDARGGRAPIQAPHNAGRHVHSPRVVQGRARASPSTTRWPLCASSTTTCAATSADIWTACWTAACSAA